MGARQYFRRNLVSQFEPEVFEPEVQRYLNLIDGSISSSRKNILNNFILELKNELNLDKGIFSLYEKIYSLIFVGATINDSLLDLSFNPTYPSALVRHSILGSSIANNITPFQHIQGVTGINGIRPPLQINPFNRMWPVLAEIPSFFQSNTDLMTHVYVDEEISINNTVSIPLQISGNTASGSGVIATRLALFGNVIRFGIKTTNFEANTNMIWTHNFVDTFPKGLYSHVAYMDGSQPKNALYIQGDLKADINAPRNGILANMPYYPPFLGASLNQNFDGGPYKGFLMMCGKKLDNMQNINSIIENFKTDWQNG